MRTGALVLRIVRQFLHDRRTLALMLLAPLAVLWMVSVIFNGNTYHPKFGVVSGSARLTQALEQAGANTTSYSSESEGIADMKSQKIDALLNWNQGHPELELEGSDPARSKSTILLLQNALHAMEVEQASSQGHIVPPLSSGGSPGASISPTVTYLYGSASMTSFDNFGPVLIGVFAFFFVFLIAGISFLKERTSGTLERLLATPLKRWQIVLGYNAGFGIFAILQAFLIVGFSVGVLHLMMNGNVFYLLLTTLLLSLTALSLGTLLSSYANTEFQMIQFIPIVIVPQIFFSGLFSIDNMAPWLRGLSRIMPLYYGANALRNIMIRGVGFERIYPDLLVLLVLTLCFMLLNVLALRKHRKV